MELPWELRAQSCRSRWFIAQFFTPEVVETFERLCHFILRSSFSTTLMFDDVCCFEGKSERTSDNQFNYETKVPVVNEHLARHPT